MTSELVNFTFLIRWANEAMDNGRMTSARDFLNAADSVLPGLEWIGDGLQDNRAATLEAAWQRLNGPAQD